MKQKHYVEPNRQEWRLIIEGLTRFRNKLIAAGRYTDAVDENGIPTGETVERETAHAKGFRHRTRA